MDEKEQIVEDREEFQKDREDAIMDPNEKENTTRIQSPEEIQKKPVKHSLKDLAK